MTKLAEVPLTYVSRGWGINNNGTIVGRLDQGHQPWGARGHAAVWDKFNNLSYLPSIAGPGNYGDYGGGNRDQQPRTGRRVFLSSLELRQRRRHLEPHVIRCVVDLVRVNNLLMTYLRCGRSPARRPPARPIRRFH